MPPIKYFRTSSNFGDLVLPTDTNTENLGFKILDYKIELSGSNLDVTSKKDKVLQVSASGTSIAENRIKLSNLPNEDLIVLLTGTGSRKLAVNYDLLPQKPFCSRRRFHQKIKMTKAHKLRFLHEPGHSIATRILDIHVQPKLLDKSCS